VLPLASEALLPTDGPLVEAQLLIDSILLGRALPQVGGEETTPRTWFTDLATVTRSTMDILFTLGANDALDRLLSQDLHEDLLPLLSAVRAPVVSNGPHRLALAARDPALTGAATAIAATLQNLPSGDAMAVRMQRLPLEVLSRMRRRVADTQASSATLKLALTGCGRPRRTINALEKRSRHPTSRWYVPPEVVPSRAYRSLIARHPDLLRNDLSRSAVMLLLLSFPDHRMMARWATSVGLAHVANGSS